MLEEVKPKILAFLARSDAVLCERWSGVEPLPRICSRSPMERHSVPVSDGCLLLSAGWAASGELPLLDPGAKPNPECGRTAPGRLQQTNGLNSSLVHSSLPDGTVKGIRLAQSAGISCNMP